MDDPSLDPAPLCAESAFEQTGVLRNNGMTFLPVEQKAARSLSISDRACILELGCHCFTGSGAALPVNVRVRRLYRGE